MSQRNWSGPIVLVSVAAAMYAVLGLIVFVWTDGLRESVLLSGFGLFGMVALAYEVGHKGYWRLGRRVTFALVFALPTVIALVGYLRRLVL
jgi:Na+/proline symporter